MITRHVIHFKAGYINIHTPQPEKVKKMKKELKVAQEKTLKRESRKISRRARRGFTR